MLSLSLIPFVGPLINLCGFTYKYFTRDRHLLLLEKNAVNAFVLSLSTKEVLTAGMDDEVHIAVLQSLDLILQDINSLIAGTSNDELHQILISLTLCIKKNSRLIRPLDFSNPKELYKAYRLLQVIRKDCAKTLAFLCASYEIDPKNPAFVNYILNFTIEPRQPRS
ncbi:hypothetical protein [Acinetobacter brisouii]|uniref:hypothetical protein n=1 Tax=Acinetobacter brisouii TaxID=396323 RepID=UPI0005F78DC8|nr:hypothetical protein [Acinetobacter brisouii]KJV41004.1 hypothetical protein VH98_01430 [Acinetobacter brisouii]